VLFRSVQSADAQDRATAAASALSSTAASLQKAATKTAEAKAAHRAARTEVDALHTALEEARAAAASHAEAAAAAKAEAAKVAAAARSDAEAAATEHAERLEALHEARDIINAAKKPVIIAGVELHRFGLQDMLLALLEESKIPVASTILSKSVIVENHPQYLGVYEGAMGREEVREYVESSDCLILLGVFMSDVNLGIFTAHLDQGKSISVTSEKVSIQYHTYEGVEMEDFIQGLIEANLHRREDTDIPHPPSPQPTGPATEKPMTVAYLFQRLNSFLDDNTVVIADPGDAMFAAMEIGRASCRERV